MMPDGCRPAATAKAGVLERAASTATFRLWIAGNHEDAIRATREFCAIAGACFAISPAAYVYTGGMEDGVCVTLIHYPRFPSDPSSLEDKIIRLGFHLLDRLFQQSFTVEGPNLTRWFSARPENV